MAGGTGDVLGPSQGQPQPIEGKKEVKATEWKAGKVAPKEEKQAKVQESADKVSDAVQLSPRRVMRSEPTVKFSKAPAPSAPPTEKHTFFQNVVGGIRRGLTQRTLSKRSISRSQLIPAAKVEKPEEKEVKEEELVDVRDKKTEKKEKKEQEKVKEKLQKAEDKKLKKMTLEEQHEYFEEKVYEETVQKVNTLSEKEKEPRLTEAAKKLIDFFSAKTDRLKEEGIFRKGGGTAKVEKLKTKLLAGQSADLSTYSIEDLASALKSVVRDLKLIAIVRDSKGIEINRDLIESYLEIGTENLNNDQKIERFQEIFTKLPPDKQVVLKKFITLCVEISKYSDVNKMTSANLGITPGGVILESGEDMMKDVAESASRAKAFTFLIDNYTKIFPEKG